MTAIGDVPCNGCTACCKSHDLIVLRPERGDVVEDYDTQHVRNPVNGRMVDALKHKPNGHCIYLEKTGCSIHDRAPNTCREFDCRLLYLNFLQGANRGQRRKLTRKHGLLGKKIFKEGRERLDTL